MPRRWWPLPISHGSGLLIVQTFEHRAHRQTDDEDDDDDRETRQIRDMNYHLTPADQDECKYQRIQHSGRGIT